jgi:hypothetical protein
LELLTVVGTWVGGRTTPWIAPVASALTGGIAL